MGGLERKEEESVWLYGTWDCPRFSAQDRCLFTLGEEVQRLSELQVQVQKKDEEIDQAGPGRTRDGQSLPRMLLALTGGRTWLGLLSGPWPLPTCLSRLAGATLSEPFPRDGTLLVLPPAPKGTPGSSAPSSLGRVSCLPLPPTAHRPRWVCV